MKTTQIEIELENRLEKSIKGLGEELKLALNFMHFMNDNRKKITGLTVEEIIKDFLADVESYNIVDIDDRDSIIFNLKALGEDKVIDSNFIIEAGKELNDLVNAITAEIKDSELKLDIIEFGEDFS